jgi:uncharacterized membrane protein YfbV (UPF0208 family)
MAIDEKKKTRKPYKFAAVILFAWGMIFSAALGPSVGKEDETIKKEITKKGALERMKENVKEAQPKVKKDVPEAGREFKESGRQLRDQAKKEFKKTGQALKKTGKELKKSFWETLSNRPRPI